jgi:hypothetical protein
MLMSMNYKAGAPLHENNQFMMTYQIPQTIQLLYKRCLSPSATVIILTTTVCSIKKMLPVEELTWLKILMEVMGWSSSSKNTYLTLY